MVGSHLLPSQFERVLEGRVEVFRDGAVALILMNRPDKRNALDAAQIDALDRALDWLHRADGVRCAVLTGAGDAFCAGGDIGTFQELGPDNGWEFTRRGHTMLRALELGRKPVIAAVAGYCIAGGLELALACDFIIAATSARMSMAEVDLGLIPGWGGTVRLSKAVPVRVARQLLLTSERLTPQRAQALGLVNEVHPDESFLARALELAAHIARQPQLAVEAAKKVMEATEGGGVMDATLDMEAALAAGLFSSSAVKERVSQWVERAAVKGKS